jgi:hypothetical protein
VALRVLRTASADPARHVSETLRDYLHTRAGLPPTATTPLEIATYLRASDCPLGRVAAVEDLMRRCDQARFAPAPSAASILHADAERLILDWEATS